MKQLITVGLLFILGLGMPERYAQAQVGVAGFWLGVTYPTNPNQAIYNYALQINQANSTLSGTAQTSNPNVPFGGVAYIKGTFTGSTVTFSESDQNGSTAVKNLCFWQGTLTYNPVDESLIGTYQNITNGTTCTDVSGGKVELYRVVLKSGNTTCKGAVPNLVVTGKNIRWYSSAAKTTLLATGNTYRPTIAQTTTFYITQTLYQNESPPIPITAEIVTPTVKAMATNTGCDKASGSIEVVASGSTGWQYSLNNGVFQSAALFAGLSPGSYTIVAKDSSGCQATQSVTITTDPGPIITDLKSTPPHCETANGEVSVVTTGGKTPLTYSINYGVSFQSSPVFTQLAGGVYTFRVRDGNGCETNRALNLPGTIPMTVQSIMVKPTSCGQANGQADLTISGGATPIQYSIDNQPVQATAIFTSLQAGTYTLLVRDGEGCTISQAIRIAASTGPPLPSIDITPEGCGQKNGAIVLKATNSPATILYSLNGSPFLSTLNFSGMRAGDYMLSIKDTADCVANQTIRIPLDCANLIQLPTAFSPNHDNHNDQLTVYFAFSSITISRFTVYDRWGTVIYNRANFVLSSGDPIWDGQQNGQPIPIGTYTYRLDCLFPDGTQTTYRESVAVLN